MKYFFTTLVFFLVLSTSNAQSDIENSQDYSLLGRLPDFHITKYVEEEFGSYGFYYDNKKQIHEGKKYTIEYRHDKEADKSTEFPTRLQILRNYSNSIEKAGGRILFERGNSEYGNYSFETANKKEIWVHVGVLSGFHYKLFIIEKEDMRQDLVIDAELIKNTLDLEGKISIYGIYFDTAKAVLKEESEPALLRIAEFLNENPKVACWVVGHTDSDGSFEVNSTLSLDRAKAVRAYLLEKHNIASERLFAEGVGPLAPVATNSSEEGKRLNRRVDLVKK